MTRPLKKGDFILITDPYDDRYLKVGEVIEERHDVTVKEEDGRSYAETGRIISYIVRFGYTWETSDEDLEEYDIGLPAKCIVLEGFRPCIH